MDIKSFITNQIKLGFNEKYNVRTNDNLFNVAYIGNHGIEYSLFTVKLQKHLEMNRIETSELLDTLTAKLDSKYFDISLNKNSINISLTKQFVELNIKQFLTQNVINKIPKKKILVDFSSPNIAKDMHVGHLRSTIIGDSICKLFELQGHDVLRTNHIGDFGLQFGMIIQHLLELYPNYDVHDFSITNLQEFYADSKKRFDIAEDFRKKAYEKVVLLQSGDEEVVKAWNFIKDISKKAYDEIYTALDINIKDVGESFYQNLIPDLIIELEEKSLIIEEDGRKIIKVSGSKMPLTLVKSDGGFTYDTTDLAAIRYRLLNLQVHQVIYVVDLGQELHFQLIFEVAKLAGWLKEWQSVSYVGFGLVLDEAGKKFKSRDGDTVKLNTLLFKSLEESEKALNQNKSNESFGDSEKEIIIKNVAYGSIKYADLSTLRTNNYKFSFDKMLSLKGNTGVYQLYQYVRIVAVLRNAGDHAHDAMKRIDDFDICDNKELEVCKVILLFPEVINKLTDDLMFHNLCTYLYGLTTTFSSFHTTCRCLHYDENKKLINVNHSRLLICIMTRDILEACFNILGINKLERM
jgi:arginyl-tRNA synthetase